MEQPTAQTRGTANIVSSTIKTEKVSPKQVTPLGETTIKDSELIAQLDKYSIEDVVDLKICRFLDQIGAYYPENVHELIMSKTEKPLLAQILKRVGGNQVHASRILGINRNTLRKKMKMYGL